MMIKSNIKYQTKILIRKSQYVMVRDKVTRYVHLHYSLYEIRIHRNNIILLFLIFYYLTVSVVIKIKSIVSFHKMFD